MTRRQLLAAAAAGSAVLTVATVGQTVRPLASAAVLAPRDPRVGPQGVPVNGAARSLGVFDVVTEPGFADDYRLVVLRDNTKLAALSLTGLRALPATEATLPIACVEGWSAEGRWRGVAVRDLLASLDLHDVDRAVIVSLQEAGRYRTSVLTSAWLRDRHTLLAYDLGREPLAPDHGFPLRLIAPNRPGVLQTKWVDRLELV